MLEAVDDAESDLNAVVAEFKSLGVWIESLDFKHRAQRTSPWGGADAVIVRRAKPHLVAWASRQPATRRLVVTRHEAALSALFEAMRDVAVRSKSIDHCSKYEFYTRLAQAAIDVETASPGASDFKVMATAVIAAACDFVIEQGPLVIVH